MKEPSKKILKRALLMMAQELIGIRGVNCRKINCKGIKTLCTTPKGKTMYCVNEVVKFYYRQATNEQRRTK